MGTRGIVGFRVNEKDYLSYNHFDSYPDFLGEGVKAAIQWLLVNHPLDYSVVRERIANLKGVERDSHYDEIRRVSREPILWMNGEETRMIFENEFVRDSCFCEYGYIINFDTEQVEFYRGFQEKPHTKGRYSDLEILDFYKEQLKDPNSKIDPYYPIALHESYSFLEWANLSMEELEKSLREEMV